MFQENQQRLLEFGILHCGENQGKKDVYKVNF